MNSNLTELLAPVRGSVLLYELVCHCKNSNKIGDRISRHALVDVASIAEVTQVLKQARVSKVHFFRII